MKRMKHDDIRKAYQQYFVQDDDSFKNVMPHISAAIADLQKADIDVELTWFAAPSETAFKMDIGNNVKTWWQSTSGILRVGNAHLLIAHIYRLELKSEEGARDVAMIALSQLDIRLQGVQTNVRCDTYFLNKDSDDLIKFQKRIIARAAVSAQIRAHDTHNAFNNSAVPAHTPLALPTRSGAGFKLKGKP